MGEMNELRKDIQEFARKAGDLLLVNYKEIPDTGRFHGKDAKSFWDKSSEELIIGMIKEKYPSHSILAEESGMEKKDEEFLWIVDPLDGTGNFINCNPFFSVSIALQINSKLVVSAINAPFLKELYFAENGKGAFLNGNRIKISDTDRIENSYVVSCEGGERDRKRIAEIRGIVLSNVLDVRKLGSAALECAWVATGRADAFISMKMPPWDVAAGVLLVREAGGLATDFNGKEWSIDKDDFLISNGKIHQKLMQLLK